MDTATSHVNINSLRSTLLTNEERREAEINEALEERCFSEGQVILIFLFWILFLQSDWKEASKQSRNHGCVGISLYLYRPLIANINKPCLKQILLHQLTGARSSQVVSVYSYMITNQFPTVASNLSLSSKLILSLPSF